MRVCLTRQRFSRRLGTSTNGALELKLRYLTGETMLAACGIERLTLFGPVGPRVAEVCVDSELEGFVLTQLEEDSRRSRCGESLRAGSGWGAVPTAEVAAVLATPGLHQSVKRLGQPRRVALSV